MNKPAAIAAPPAHRLWVPSPRRKHPATARESPQPSVRACSFLDHNGLSVAQNQGLYIAAPDRLRPMDVWADAAGNCGMARRHHPAAAKVPRPLVWTVAITGIAAGLFRDEQQTALQVFHNASQTGNRNGRRTEDAGQRATIMTATRRNITHAAPRVPCPRPPAAATSRSTALCGPPVHHACRIRQCARVRAHKSGPRAARSRAGARSES
jgi:hypothetical protein